LHRPPIVDLGGLTDFIILYTSLISLYSCTSIVLVKHGFWLYNLRQSRSGGNQREATANHIGLGSHSARSPQSSAASDLIPPAQKIAFPPWACLISLSLTGGVQSRSHSFAKSESLKFPWIAIALLTRSSGMNPCVVSCSSTPNHIADLSD
jgi:hypothetical protein